MYRRNIFQLLNQEKFCVDDIPSILFVSVMYVFVFIHLLVFLHFAYARDN